MGLRNLPLFALCIFFLLFSGSSFAEKAPKQEENQQNIPPTSPPWSRPNSVDPNMKPTKKPRHSVGGSWCIASSAASPTALQVALDFACGLGGADCSAIQPGGSCYEPNTARDHASYAFNEYYQKNPVPTSCSFGGTAQLVSTDPSSGNCHFATPGAVPSFTPPGIPGGTPSPPVFQTLTPPTATNPIYQPGGIIYGAGPSATPSSATSISNQLLLLLATSNLLGFLVANHL